MKARFEQGINVKTGEFLGKDVAFNWLEWLVPKKRFGFNTGYRFKTGNLYRLLVRQKISGPNDKFKVYYIEEVLEKNVKERRLDVVNQFEEQITQMLVLVKNRIHGWVVENDYRKPTTTFLAAIDSRTNELISEYGTLSWIEKNTKRGLRFNFDDMEIYHVSVRKSKERDNFYLLENITRRGKDERLKQIREEYLKPVTIKTEFGNFLLDRKCNSLLVFYSDELFAGHFIIIEIDEHGRFAGTNLEG